MPLMLIAWHFLYPNDLNHTSSYHSKPFSDLDISGSANRSSHPFSLIKKGLNKGINALMPLSVCATRHIQMSSLFFRLMVPVCLSIYQCIGEGEKTLFTVFCLLMQKSPVLLTNASFSTSLFLKISYTYQECETRPCLSVNFTL
ncbi:hypothetical protein VA7868_03981 [Vibrio aerogenes CECT 7868]|uniref:Uncharacterized protein n=1 Tax=Vibrio aerogenes CECT 7868 TaxID=1216006 RepID=A0A1M6CBF0_9VIBR|nr:hypothetical protein VA7868_03981 [Vibrio aerogenes CECT 7868]